MLLSTNTYRRGETEKESHDLFVDFSEDFLFDGCDRSSSNLNIGFPYPISKPCKGSSTHTKDIFKEHTEYKRLYQEKLKDAQTKGLLEDVQEIYFENDTNEDTKYVNMPRTLLELYQLKSSGQYPIDSNFCNSKEKCDLVFLNNRIYFVWLTINSKICFTDLENSSCIQVLPFKNKTAVCGLRTYNCKTSSQIIILEKCKVTLLNILSMDKYSVLYSHGLKEAIINAKLNKNDTEHIGIVCENQQITIWNIMSDKVVFKEGKLESKLLQFEFWKEDKLVLMNETLVEIFNYKDNLLVQTFDPKLLPCNTLCNLLISKDILLLASRHYIIKTDLKELNNVSTFAHTMKNAPIYMDLIINNEDTYLCLGNHFQEDNIVFCGKALFSLPYKILSLKDTLRQAALKNADLVLVDKLYERLNFCVAGLKLFEINNNVYIYFVNFLGEIFKQQLSYNLVDNIEPIKNLLMWIQELEKPEPAVYVTNFEEMSDVFFFLNRHLPETNAKVQSSNADKLLKKFKNKFCTKNITSTFAKGFLEIWNDSEESDDEDLPSTHEPEVPFYDKVSSWMEKMNDDS